jgi:kinesin family protein 2/24
LDEDDPGSNDAVPEDDGQTLRVYCRKRPMFEKEEKLRSDFDIVTILPEQPVQSRVVLHNCLFQADLKTPFVNHLEFEFDRVFDEGSESWDVYCQSGANLVRSSLAGGVSTMFMFGQTGSGKTHTMSAIQEFAARDLFRGADGEEPWLSVQFVELRGNRCFDLLAPSAGDGRKGNIRPELKLREQGDGAYSADGAVDLFPKTPEELCAVMAMAQSRRFTRATDANDVSSRSHAVCTMRIFQSDGQLMLVDCAGTERRKDSMYHSKDRQQEGAEINASLHALKECVRHLVTQQRVPSHAYRASSLTKILADAFIRGADARLAVICTVSPCATDTEHTVATMRMGMGLGGHGAEREEKQSLTEWLQAQKKPRVAHPKQWTPEQVCEWLRGAANGQFRDVADAVPSNFTGQMLVRLTEGRCVQLCGGHEKRGRCFFDLLHQEIQRVEHSRKSSG